MKKKLLAGIIVAIMLIMMVSASTATINLDQKADETTKRIAAPDPIQPSFKKIPLQPQQNPQRHPNAQPISVGTDVQITSSGQIDGHSCVTIDHDGNPIIVYDYRTTEGHSEIYLQRSPDGGETWPSNQKYYLAGNESFSAINPVISINDNGTGAALIFQKENQPDPYIYVIALDDLDDPDSWYIGYFNQSWATDWIGQTNGETFGTHYGTWTYISDVIWEDYNETETLRIAYVNDTNKPEYYQGIFFFADENTYFSNPTSAAGTSLYAAGQQNTLYGSRIQIAWALTSQDIVFEDWKYSQVGSSTSNTTYPALATSGEYAYLAVQDDQNGNNDIHCYLPAGFSWVRKTVADSNDDEMYPSITAFENIAIITFVKNGDLYMSRSDDAGETWSAPVQINDENNEVVEEYRTANIVGPYIGWMDNRNGNPDIYCDTTELPWVAITEISGGLGTTGSVKNIGTEDATGVPWELTIQGGILGLINTSKSGNADIAVGEVNAIRSGLFFGLGPIKITLTVDNVQRDPEGLQLIILTLI